MQSDDFRFVLKIETDGIAASKVLCATLYDIDRHEVFNFSDQPGANPIAAACEFLAVVDLVIVQSAYALKTLGALRGLQIPKERVIDTLLLARSMAHSGNSLDAWSDYFGANRQPFRGAATWSESVQRHCETDAILIATIYEYLHEQVTV